MLPAAEMTTTEKLLSQRSQETECRPATGIGKERTVSGIIYPGRDKRFQNPGPIDVFYLRLLKIKIQGDLTIIPPPTNLRTASLKTERGFIWATNPEQGIPRDFIGSTQKSFPPPNTKLRSRLFPSGHSCSGGKTCLPYPCSLRDRTAIVTQHGLHLPKKYRKEKFTS